MPGPLDKEDILAKVPYLQEKNGEENLQLVH